MDVKEYYSTIEAAKRLGITRIAVFKRIQRGTLAAKRIGRNYIIKDSEVERLKAKLRWRR